MSRRTLETRELAACLRHDLRDPLGAITHWLHLLDRAPLDAAMRERATAGIRSAMDEQLRQIERLGQVLELAQVLPAPLLSEVQGGADRLSVRGLIDQVLVALGAGQRNRIEVGEVSEVSEVGDWEIAVQTEALVDALTSLLLHGLRQLLAGERLRILGRLDAPARRVALCLQARPAALGAIEQPWRMLAEAQPAPSLAVLHARCVLSRHQAELRITTLDTDGDTLEIDFPVSSRSDRTST